jgi:hypothetical protein
MPRTRCTGSVAQPRSPTAATRSRARAAGTPGPSTTPARCLPPGASTTASPTAARRRRHADRALPRRSGRRALRARTFGCGVRGRAGRAKRGECDGGRRPRHRPASHVATQPRVRQPQPLAWGPLRRDVSPHAIGRRHVHDLPRQRARRCGLGLASGAAASRSCGRGRRCVRARDGPPGSACARRFTQTACRFDPAVASGKRLPTPPDTSPDRRGCWTNGPADGNLTTSSMREAAR